MSAAPVLRVTSAPVVLPAPRPTRGSGGGEGLLVPRDSPVHRLPAQCKVVALVAMALVAVAVPPGRWAAFGALAALLALVVGLARLPVLLVVRRLVVEAPFAVFALLLPFVAGGERTSVLGVEVSAPGLLGAGTLLAKATLGVAAAVVLASTTSARDLLGGLARLHLPAALLSVLSFMVRYAAVVADDLRRVRTAREARGASGTRLRHLGAVAAGVGSVFVRTYERGERVHRSMLARGHRPGTPLVVGTPAGPRSWLAAAALPAAGLLAVLVLR